MRHHYNRFYLSKKREKGRIAKFFLNISEKHRISEELRPKCPCGAAGEGTQRIIYGTSGQGLSILMIPQEKRKVCRTLTAKKIFFYHDEKDDVLSDD